MPNGKIAWLVFENGDDMPPTKILPHEPDSKWTYQTEDDQPAPVKQVVYFEVE